ncbi:MAG: hypothetical protein SXA11_25155 [Cyanobacteriota bacterium]|nr:hypothetical protein [Cyanobacteriota bacterium]
MPVTIAKQWIFIPNGSPIEALAAVSEELLTVLEDRLLTLDREEIQEAVDGIADTAPVVARQLESLVDSFSDREILDLIEETKSIEKEDFL